ncbi:MAG: hypothetical protein VX642_15240 [Bdellovibrionota bacterium]|nr:hypothetical protein [Bdellovibrionota bacterium]
MKLYSTSLILFAFFGLSQSLHAYNMQNICGELKQAYKQAKSRNAKEKCVEVQRLCRSNALENISSDFCNAAKSWNNMCEYSLSEACKKRPSISGNTEYEFQRKMADFCSFNHNRRRDRFGIKLNQQSFANCAPQVNRPLTVNSNTKEEYNCGEIYQANIEGRAQANSFSEYLKGSDYSSFTAVDSTNPNLHYRSYQCFAKIKISDNAQIISLGDFTVNGEQFNKKPSSLCILKDTFGKDEIYCKKITEKSCRDIVQYTDRTSFDRMIDNLSSDTIDKYEKSFNSAFKNTQGKDYIEEIVPQNIKKGAEPLTEEEKKRFQSHMKEKCYGLFPSNAKPSFNRGNRTPLGTDRGGRDGSR